MMAKFLVAFILTVIASGIAIVVIVSICAAFTALKGLFQEEESPPTDWS